MTTKVESTMAKALGLTANASAADVDDAIRQARFHAYLNGKLGLPIDATGDDVLAKVNARCDSRAAAVGLPAGAKLPEIEAAEAQAAERAAKVSPPTPPALPARIAAGGGRTDAADDDNLVDRLVNQTLHPLSAIADPDEGMVTRNGREPGQPSDPSRYR